MDVAARQRWRWWILRNPGLRGTWISKGPGGQILLDPRARVTTGVGVKARGPLDLMVAGHLEIGSSVFFGAGACISCYRHIRIGDQVRCAERVSIHDADHCYEPIGMPGGRDGLSIAPVHIGDRVWLAAGVVVTSGARIGADTVVAANSVVTSELPAGVLAGGAPARVLRQLGRA